MTATTATTDGRRIELSRDDQAGRYVASVEGEPAGTVGFTAAPGLVTITHTETDPAFEGQGVASALARHALDDVRGLGLRVRPECPFVKAFVERHAEAYGDLLE